jgi:hypothetical protein
MSSQNNNRNNKSVSKPFCKVCFDAKKSESEYTSHYVRRTTDPNSEILCPVLLATECRYCHVAGHTITKCTLREKNNARRSNPETQRPRDQERPREPVKVVEKKTTNNKFAVFEDDCEEVVPEIVASKDVAFKNVAPEVASKDVAFKNVAPEVASKVDEFPALGFGNKLCQPVSTKKSYVSASLTLPSLIKEAVQVSQPVRMVVDEYEIERNRRNVLESNIYLVKTYSEDDDW